MRKLLLTAGAMVAFAASAQAVTISGAFGAPDPGPLPGQTLAVSFDGPNAAGFTWSGGLGTSCVNQPGVAATPAGGTTCFGYVSSNLNPNTATLSTPNLSAISFYWGSIDLYNEVKVLGAGNVVLGTFSGGVLPPSNGNQSTAATNRRVSFTAGAGEVITGLVLTSTGVAFEFDDFYADAASTTNGIPEPASWAMLIAGFGLVGAVSRRRNLTVAA
jgi:hypothetical protein